MSNEYKGASFVERGMTDDPTFWWKFASGFIAKKTVLSNFTIELQNGVSYTFEKGTHIRDVALWFEQVFDDFSSIVQLERIDTGEDRVDFPQNENIMCPYERGELPMSECLRCAFTNENQQYGCGYSYPLLNSIYQRSNRPGIHVTDLTSPCARNVYYRKMHPAPINPSSMLLANVGTAVHTHIEDKVFDDEHVWTEMKLDAFGIVGSADLYLSNGTLIDIKTKRWMKIEHVPSQDHVVQINIYRVMLQNMGYEVNDMYINYIDTSGASRCKVCSSPLTMIMGTLRCPNCGKKQSTNSHLGAVLVRVEAVPDEKVKSMIMVKRDALLKAIRESTPPDPNVTWLCRFCPFEQCHEHPSRR